MSPASCIHWSKVCPPLPFGAVSIGPLLASHTSEKTQSPEVGRRGVLCGYEVKGLEDCVH